MPQFNKALEAMHTFPNLPYRKPTFCFKWEKYSGQDILPMWVADTEFACAEPILSALKQRVDHGVLGYTLPAQYAPANEAVVNWLATQYNWTIEADWIVWTPGVVPAFNVACKAYGGLAGKGRVLVQEPNYPPLRMAAELNGLESIRINTLEQDGRLNLDWEQLEREAAHPDTHLFLLCNPMNPVGTVLTAAELDKIAQICARHNVFVCSDEIHCDLILNPDLPHLPASKQPNMVDNSVTLMAASKTFNIAGLGTSFAIIPNPKNRKKFTQAAMGIVPWANIMGLVATEVAFTQCSDWYQAQLTYLRENRRIVETELNEIAGLRVMPSDATFLAWIDATGLDVKNVQSWCESRGVGPSPGADFGWSNYFRLNFGCGRDMLKEALTRLKAK